MDVGSIISECAKKKKKEKMKWRIIKLKKVVQSRAGRKTARVYTLCHIYLLNILAGNKKNHVKGFFLYIKI